MDQETLITLLNEPVILAPIVFASGFTLDSIAFPCYACHRPIKAHGHIHWINRHVVQVDACGFCERCQMVTPSFSRIYDDGRIVGLTRSGDWATRYKVVCGPLHVLLHRIKTSFVRLWRL